MVKVLVSTVPLGFHCSSLWHGGSGRAWLSVTGVSVPLAFYCFVPVFVQGGIVPGGRGVGLLEQGNCEFAYVLGLFCVAIGVCCGPLVVVTCMWVAFVIYGYGGIVSVGES